MRKLVLGIIALVSVQFAFVTYMMVLQSSAELTTAPSQTESIPAKSEPTQIDTVRAEAIPEPESPASPVLPRIVKDKRVVPQAPVERAALDRPAVARISTPAFNPASSRAAAPAEFESVVIRYDRSGSISDCDTRDKPKSKKRSFIAKAGPVLKKPWDWIKAVGSKLN